MEIGIDFYKKLSDICADIGQVCFASLVVPLIGQSLDTNLAVSGLLLAVIFWAFSLWVATKAKGVK